MEKENYSKQKERMVREQLIRRGIKDERVLDAFRKVPRHLFVDPADRPLAYGDHPLPIGLEQTISQPYIVALMTEALQLKGNEKVLEIGTGSGYQAAILAELVEHVYTVERLPYLGERARKRLEQLGYTNISFKIGDGTKGWPEKAPFDGILVTAASEKIPPSLLEQLKPGGRLVIPLGNTWLQDLTLVINENGHFKKESLGGCRFVPLIGDEEDK